jgi:hypothetical protein
MGLDGYWNVDWNCLDCRPHFISSSAFGWSEYAIELGGIVGHPAARLFYVMWRACNLTAFIHSSTGPVVQPFASCHEGPGFNPQEVLMWNCNSPVSIVLLHWWPQRDWSSRPRLRWASFQTVTRTLFWQCDNPTWSHIVLLYRFHACCRSSFLLYNQHSRLLGGSPVESKLTAFIHSSTGPEVHPFASCHEGPGFNPQGGGVLMWNWDSPVSVVTLH